MLVGVEVRRISPDEQSETVELAPEVIRRPPSHGGGGPGRTSFRDQGRPPASDFNMQSNAKARSLSCSLGSVDGRRTLHHEARARHDAALVSFDDSAIDAAAIAEVVRVDNQVAHDGSAGITGTLGTFLTMTDAARRGSRRSASAPRLRHATRVNLGR
jgi:hypothetical protein